MRFFLKNPRLRLWVAYWLVEQLNFGSYTDPSPPFLAWLKTEQQISIAELRKLILANFIWPQRYAEYYGEEFTTLLSRKNFGWYPYNLIFPLYNSLSDEGPIKTHTHYFEQIGGMSKQADLLRRTADFVKGELKINIVFTADRKNYGFDQPVNLALTIQNLTDEQIILHNPEGPTVEFIVDWYEGDVEEYVRWSTESEEWDNNKVVLLANDSIVIRWIPEPMEEGTHSITACVYIPHYGHCEKFIIHLCYGKVNTNTFIEPYIKDFFAV